MRSLKTTVMGTLVGTLVGAAFLLLVYALFGLNGGANGLPASLVVSTLAGGAAAGATCVSLRSLVTRRERLLLALLVTAAVASLVVLPGNYLNRSVVPPVLYGMALVNGLLVARVSSVLCRADEKNRYHS